MRQPIPFGKYLLLERITVGGMAEVFKAKAFGVEGFEKILAIKRILPSMAEDADFIEMFIDEAKIAGQLNHANICQIFELGRVDDSHFIAMEYVWGKDLLQIQNRFRKMQPDDAAPRWRRSSPRRCARGSTTRTRRRTRPASRSASSTATSRRRTCSCRYEGELKIIDFGIAKAASRSSKTQAGVLKGKFGYMSPEQVRGLPLDRRCDIFAIGTILYELLTAERLFLGESDFATLEKVRNVDVPPPSKVNPSVPAGSSRRSSSRRSQGRRGSLPVGGRDAGGPAGVPDGRCEPAFTAKQLVAVDARAVRRRDEARAGHPRRAAQGRQGGAPQPPPPMDSRTGAGTRRGVHCRAMPLPGRSAARELSSRRSARARPTCRRAHQLPTISISRRGDDGPRDERAMVTPGGSGATAPPCCRCRASRRRSSARACVARHDRGGAGGAVNGGDRAAGAVDGDPRQRAASSSPQAAGPVRTTAGSHDHDGSSPAPVIVDASARDAGAHAFDR